MYTLIIKEIEAWLSSNYTGAQKGQPLHHTFRLSTVTVAYPIPSVSVCVLALLSEKNGMPCRGTAQWFV